VPIHPPLQGGAFSAPAGKGYVLETLGDYLKNKREAQNITLEEVSQTTRIRRTILQAIENNHYDLIPPKVFTQGFIKSYASYLGLDENDVIKRYHEIMESLEIKTDTEEPIQQKPPQPFLTPTRLLVLGIVFIVVLTLWLLRKNPQPGDDTVLKSTQQTSSTSSANSPPLTSQEVSGEEDADHTAFDTEKPAVLEEEPPPEGEKEEETVEAAETGEVEAAPMALRVVATEQAWMKIQLDQGEAYEVILKSGESLTLKAQEKFIIRIGNAGGVELFFNEEPLGNPGKPGEVIDLTLPE
jgi:cytoskeletal protein RodZ